jgi:hypothetical protein
MAPAVETREGQWGRATGRLKEGNIVKRLLGVTLLTVVLCSVGLAGPLWTSTALPATSSYLLGDPTADQPNFLADTEDWPWFISLSGLGLSPGQQITISVAGDLCYSGGCQAELPAVLGLVFTTSNNVLGFQNVERLEVADGGNVPSGAVGALSPTTYYQGLSTDINGDFQMIAGDTVTVIIPDGAAWLAVGVWDSYFRDNYDPTPNVTVSVGTPDAVIPEPGTYMMAFAGLVGLWALRRKKA